MQNPLVPQHITGLKPRNIEVEAFLYRQLKQTAKDSVSSKEAMSFSNFPIRPWIRDKNPEYRLYQTAHSQPHLS
jgi:hypothetical protein